MVNFVTQINATLNEISAILQLLKINDGKHANTCVRLMYPSWCPDGSICATKNANSKVKVSAIHCIA